MRSENTKIVEEGIKKILILVQKAPKLVRFKKDLEKKIKNF